MVQIGSRNFGRGCLVRDLCTKLPVHRDDTAKMVIQMHRKCTARMTDMVPPILQGIGHCCVRNMCLVIARDSWLRRASSASDFPLAMFMLNPRGLRARSMASTSSATDWTTQSARSCHTQYAASFKCDTSKSSKRGSSSCRGTSTHAGPTHGT